MRFLKIGARARFIAVPLSVVFRTEIVGTTDRVSLKWLCLVCAMVMGLMADLVLAKEKEDRRWTVSLSNIQYSYSVR